MGEIQISVQGVAWFIITSPGRTHLKITTKSEEEKNKFLDQIDQQMKRKEEQKQTTLDTINLAEKEKKLGLAEELAEQTADKQEPSSISQRKRLYTDRLEKFEKRYESLRKETETLDDEEEDDLDSDELEVEPET